MPYDGFQGAQYEVDYLGIVRTMNPFLYFGSVLLALLAFSIALALVARSTKWKPKPIKPAWALLVIVGAVLVAGLVCSIAGEDIHILWWWLLGLPIAAVAFPVCVILGNLISRLFIRTICFIFGRHR